MKRENNENSLNVKQAFVQSEITDTPCIGFIQRYMYTFGTSWNTKLLALESKPTKFLSLQDPK